MMLFCFWESSRVFVPGGSFFGVDGEGWREGRTGSLPARRLHGRAPVRRSKPLVILGA